MQNRTVIVGYLFDDRSLCVEVYLLGRSDIEVRILLVAKSGVLCIGPPLSRRHGSPPTPAPRLPSMPTVGLFEPVPGWLRKAVLFKWGTWGFPNRRLLSAEGVDDAPGQAAPQGPTIREEV